MTGADYNSDDDADEPETFGLAPHPDDRLWRHPSEIAAMKAAHANAETAKVPAIQLIDQPSRSRLQIGMMVAAGVVVVGAAALTIGVVSGRGSSNNPQVASEVAGILPAAEQETTTFLEPSAIADTDIAVDVTAEGEELLTDRVHNVIANSLPRIQAATATGMREGSGFFVTEEGHIATSAGLIENADYIIARTDDGQRWTAEVIAVDMISDVAVLQIASESWPAVSLSSDNDFWSGQYALALDHEDDEITIGEVTTTTGPLVGIDQPSAVPGSAIIDDTGSVIAMVTADGTNSHATPAWLLEQVAVDLISAGSTTHTWLGVLVEASVDQDDAAQGMVVVGSIIVDSPAHDAGLRPGDLIDTLNGTPTPDFSTLNRLVQAAKPGEDAVLTVTRNDSRRIIIATLTALPAD